MSGASDKSVQLGRDGRYRCGACEAVVTTGSAHCLICHADLAWPHTPGAREAAMGPTTPRQIERAVCPRAHGSLVHAEIHGGHVHACAPCGGLFLETAASSALIEDASFREALAVFAADLDSKRTEQVDGAKVGYPPCAACGEGTARKNFERVSGVMVDVCRNHGTWFDGGEVIRVVAFLAGDGLSRKESFEAREAETLGREREKIKEIEKKIQARDRYRKF